MVSPHEYSCLHDQLAANIALSGPGISLDMTCTYVDSPAESDPLTLGQGRRVELWGAQDCELLAPAMWQ